MSRDESFLNTGLSSALERRKTAEEQQRKQDRIYKRGKLTPGAEIILEWLNKEKETVYKNIAALPINIETTEENVKSVLLAYQMQLNFVDNLILKTKNVLREIPEEAKDEA